MTAMNPAIIGIVNYWHRPRGQNIARASCQSAENYEKYMRLGQQEIAELSHEYMHWRSHTEGVSAPQFLLCFALFTLLWSETLV